MKKTSSKSTLCSLPQEIQVDIFLRIPVDSIVSCRCVCKPWRTLLRSPSFIKYHFNLTIQNNNPKLMLIDYIWDGGIKVPATYDYASISSYSSMLDSSCECNGAVRIDYPLEYNKGNYIDVLGSCNGLICMGISSDILGASMRYKDTSICIWNPSTREYKKIPVHMRDCSLYSDNRCNVRYGFGYDHIINDYKLVRISGYENSSCFEVEVYTLGSSTWSCARAIRYTFPYERRFRGWLFNGALHWLGVAVTQENAPEAIVSFDISSEKVLELPLLPEQTMLYQGNRNARKNLGTLGSCLCLVSNIPLIHTDRVMRKYGVAASCTKQFTFSQQITPKYLYSKPIWSLQNGEILIHVDYGFVLFDPSNGSQRILNVQEIQISSITLCHRQPVIYTESLVSLNTGTYV